MAKTTRSSPPNLAPVAVMEPPEETEEPELHEIVETPEAQTPPPETAVNFTADKETLDAKRGRGAVKEGAAGFFVKLTRYKTAEWEKLMLYVYRLAPITDRTASGTRPKYISKYAQAIDEDTILREHGSGAYRITLNRADEHGVNSVQDRIEFDIENVQYPPVVPPGEWLDDPRNKRWAWARPAGAGPQTPPQQTANAGPSLKDMIAGVRELSAMAKANNEGQNLTGANLIDLPSKILAAAQGIVEISKPPAGPPPADPTKQFEQTLLLVTKIVEMTKPPAVAPPPPPPDPVAQIKGLSDMITAFKGAFGGEGLGGNEGGASARSRMSGWQEMLQPFLERLAEPLARMAEGAIVSARMPSRPTGVGMMRTNPPPQPSDPNKPLNPIVENEPMPQRPSNAFAGIAEQIVPRLLFYLTSGFPGGDFAAEIFDTFGVFGMQQARKLGKEGVTNILQANPEIWQQIEPIRPNFEIFVDEFLQWTPEDEQEPEPAAAPPPQSGQARGKKAGPK